jgi:hypothetical protein
MINHKNSNKLCHQVYLIKLGSFKVDKILLVPYLLGFFARLI